MESSIDKLGIIIDVNHLNQIGHLIQGFIIQSCTYISLEGSTNMMITPLQDQIGGNSGPNAYLALSCIRLKCALGLGVHQAQMSTRPGHALGPKCTLDPN